MLDRLIGLLRRLTSWELAVVGLVALLPIAALSALTVGIVTDPVLGLIVIWAYVGLMAIAASIAGVVRRAVRRRFRAERQEADRWSRPAPGVTRQLHGEARLVAIAAQLPRHAVHNFAARTQSKWAREIVAYRASQGRLDFSSLTEAIRGAERGDKSGSRLVLGDLDPTALVDLVRLLASQDLDPRSRSQYQAILKYVGRLGAVLKVRHESQTVLVERLMLAGRADLARPLVEKWATSGLRELMLAVDLVNPYLSKAPVDARAAAMWLGAFNQIFRGVGIEPVVLLDAGPTVFDRLSAPRIERRTAGTLVSVIMTCFKPDEGLVTAVRSMVAQSWTNWELLVMDDASPQEHHEVLDRVAGMDPRIRVVRATVNAGTYVRRNEALDLARGEFVTMHDSDDWAHPRRLELQIMALLDSPDEIANLSSCVRVTEQLAFVQARGAKLRPAESSIVFRREAAMTRIGYYDSVRKAADSEYRLRIEAAFGRPVPTIDSGGPLTLVRYLPQSLSGAEFRDGWVHESRVAYRNSAWAWHERIRQGRADPYLAHPLEVRPFRAPARLEGRVEPPREFDVIVVLDGRRSASAPGYGVILAGDLQRLADRGQVGFQQIDSLCADPSLGLVGDEIQELVDAGTIERILEGGPAHAAVVIVRNASIAQGLEAKPGPITASRSIVLEDPRSGRDRLGVDFSRGVTRTVAAMFGPAPEYITVRDGFDVVDLLESHAGEDEQRDADANADLVARFGPVQGLPAGTGWEARAGTLRALVDVALELPEGATIVEAGSGLSTFWFARAAEAAGRTWRIVALEHEHRFAEETRALLRANGLEGRAEVVFAPLEAWSFERGAFDWYAAEALDGIDQVRLLFVDGPPSSVGSEARYPAFPALRGRLADGCVVVVDDADRFDERAILRAWRALAGQGTLEFERSEGRTAFLRFQR